MPGHAVVEQMTRDHTRPARYAWTIDKDHLCSGQHPDPYCDEGVTGPSNAPDDLLTRLNNGDGETFRMYDDDGELYYTGRIIARDEDGDMRFPTVDDTYFGPLWDYGTPGAGAVTIKYQQGAVWVTL